jgi:5-methylcytosine-specific restriction endonuclease McrA
VDKNNPREVIGALLLYSAKHRLYKYKGGVPYKYGLPKKHKKYKHVRKILPVQEIEERVVDPDGILPVQQMEEKLRVINPDGIPASEWNSLHKDKLSASHKKYQDKYKQTVKYKDTRRATKHKRRAVLHNSGGSYTHAQWEQKKLEFDYRCAYCHKKTELSVDHIIPLSRGGTNDISNIVPACLECNSHKGSRLSWLPQHTSSLPLPDIKTDI